MRSEIITRAHERMSNRYELCQMAAKVTRCLHFASSDTQTAINDAFSRLATPAKLPGTFPGRSAETDACLFMVND